MEEKLCLKSDLIIKQFAEKVIEKNKRHRVYVPYWRGYFTRWFDERFQFKSNELVLRKLVDKPDKLSYDQSIESYISIYSKSKLVFEVYLDIGSRDGRKEKVTAYVPGDWEKQVEEIYLKVLDMEKQEVQVRKEEEKEKQRQKTEKKLKEVKERWGIEFQRQSAMGITSVGMAIPTPRHFSIY